MFVELVIGLSVLFRTAQYVRCQWVNFLHHSCSYTTCTLCLKKLSLLCLATTLTSHTLMDFANFWEKCYWESSQLEDDLFSHLT